MFVSLFELFIKQLKNCAIYQGYGGEELLVHNYEVLAMNDKHFSWQPSSSGFVPFGAVATGSDGGDTLYVGRGHHDGSLTVGKVSWTLIC